ncbi:MAG: ribonuclease III [Candidatus Margulisbacteria bacterium]|jgi:ribonuclease-3|nr:ribonuclease III [Candidatus Margulisiibacteriota bacterium]
MEPLAPERERALQELEKKLGLSFLNKSLLNQSLSHSSYGHAKGVADNERLEFLGDAVLKLVTTEYLYNKFPDRAEGDLTKIRAAVISDETLAQIAKKLLLGDFLLLSENEMKSGGQKRKSNIANAFEALLGAVFLDAGLGKARDLVLDALRDEIEKVSRAGYISDYKSALQEYAQKHKYELPHYRVIKESGPKHRRVFWMEVKVKGRRYGVGRGANKKESEQRAAAMGLKRIKQEERGAAPEKRPAVRRSGDNRTAGIRALLNKVRKKMNLE